MTKREADKMLMSRLEELDVKADATESTAELVDLVETEIKLYITLCNAGAFDDMSNVQSGGMQS